MADFINTIDVLGDDAVTDSVIDRSITEIADNNTVSIGNYAFSPCKSLTNVNFPAVITIGNYAFDGCSALVSAYFPAATSVVSYSFRDCPKLINVDFSALTTIGYNAFDGCSALTSVYFPAATTSNDNAFIRCSKLTSANFPMLTSTGSSMFANCSKLTDVDFSAVTMIKDNTFARTSLEKLILRNTSNVCTLSSTNAFINTKITSGTGYIYVPAALVDSYKAATNWSTYANQFRAIEDWSVDGTVTGELDIENRAMVRFFNDDGTLLGYSVVTKGSNATYNGTPVCSEDPSRAFEGFVPPPTNVTVDMDCYAQYEEPFNLATASWERISEISASGDAANYMNVGDTKSVDIGSYGVYNMEIVAFDADDKEDGTGKAPITWISKEVVATHSMTTASNNAGGWVVSEMRSWLRGDFYAELPENVRNSIVPVNKTYYDRSTTSTLSCADNVWIPSLREVIGSSGQETSGVTYTSHFKNNDSRIKKKSNGYANHWWVRTADFQYASNYWSINQSGGSERNGGTGALGVVLGFCT